MQELSTKIKTHRVSELQLNMFQQNKDETVLKVIYVTATNALQIFFVFKSVYKLLTAKTNNHHPLGQS